ncbi:ribosome 60S biogenesis N-terminal-domain-containing protein [Sporodiniella umbellata]|nr:ribosome 60S biogenesis N-terminal-domain-containing protein [Sporodiniella umbellata]
MSTAQSEEYYKTPKEISEALKVKDLASLTKGLSKLRAQLNFAVKDRVDPTEKQTRPLVEYAQSCNDCYEINNLWDYQASTNIQDLECMLPDIVGLFIKLCKTPVIRTFGTQIIETILTRQMKYIYRGISSMRIPQCQSTFRLMTAMVSFHQTMAREFFSTFNFQTEGFLRASRYRQNRKNNNNPLKYIYDLRTNYVQFVLAFFQHGDAEIKKQVLGVKGVVSAIFMHIYEDAYQLIESILKVSYENLIMDSAVPRSVKAFFFSSYILEKIAKLYNRFEPEPISSEETAIPADIVHHFLISACSVVDVGVCYRDNGWYPMQISSIEEDKQSKIANRVLIKFMNTLKPADDMRQQELLLKILGSCPELIKEFWKTSVATFEARVSSKWLANMTVLQKIVSLPVPSLSYGNTGLYSAEPPAAATVLENILPNAFNRSFSSKGLQHTSALVRYTTMVVLSATFQKYNKTLLSFESVICDLESLEIKDASRSKSSENWKKCLQAVREGLRRRTPEIQTIVSLFKQTTSSDKEGEEEIQRQLLQETSFRLIRYYQEFVPESLMETNIDPSHFIPTDILSVKPGILIQLLHLFLNMPNFNWTGRSTGSSTHITTLLTLYLQTPYRHIRELTGKLINQTLSDSFMFSHDPNEVQLWLDALPQHHTDDLGMSETQQRVLQYLDKCITIFNKAQYKYTDKLVALFESVHEAHPGRASEYQHPFSPLLLTLRENLDFIKDNKQPAILYFTSLVSLLIGKQTVPYYLQQLCSSLKVGDIVNPVEASQWDQDLMVRSAHICLGIDSVVKTDIQCGKKQGALIQMIGKEVSDISVSRKEFIDALEQTSVGELATCLEDIAKMCCDVLGWSFFEPLVEYICIRHPMAGSLFSYFDAISTNSLEGEETYTTKLVQTIPFVYLFHNIILYRQQYKNKNAFSAIAYALDHAKTTDLSNVISHLFLQVYIAKAKKDYETLDCLFKILQKVIKRIHGVADIHLQRALYSSITYHPVIKDLRSDLTLNIQHAKKKQDKLDNQLISLAASFIDIFADEAHAQSLMDCVVLVDFRELNSNKTRCSDSIKKLLITLVHHVCRHFADVVQVPGKIFENIAAIWTVEQKNVLDQDVLLLLESTMAHVEMSNETKREATVQLLNTFCVPILDHILLGHACKIHPDLLYSSCESSNVDLASLILERLDGRLCLTTDTIRLIQMSRAMSVEDSTVFDVQVIEYILKRLVKAMDAQMICENMLEEGFFDRLSEYLREAESMGSLLDAEIVRDLILTVLMDAISDAGAVRFLAVLVKSVYSQWEKREPIETYLRRILGHNEYIQWTAPDLTRALAKETPENSSQRTALIELIAQLNTLQPLILAENHGLLDTLLTSYSATTSIDDKNLLAILMSAERHGRTSLLGKMTLWGPGSDKTRQVQLQAGGVLQLGTVSNDTLSLIDPAVMKYTMTHLPQYGATASPNDKAHPIYDPSFFLPLFANLLSSGSMDCRKFIDCNGLGLTTVCLSSTDLWERRVAYQMMDQYYVLLEHGKFKEQSTVAFVLESFRHSIIGRSALEEPPRIPLCISVCVAHALSVLLHPGHYMFPHITKWVLQNSAFDFDYIPMFSSLFNSASSNNKKERLWLLHVLLSSLRTYEDYKIFSRQRIFDVIATFYNSSYVDESSQRVIVEILEKATEIPGVTTSLVHHKGLLAWIFQSKALGNPIFNCPASVVLGSK